MSKIPFNNVLLEACVETFEQCKIAEKKGAHRLELCANLEEGGLSPSEDLIKKVLAEINIPVKVMLRPRPGDFTYYNDEFELMKKQLYAFQELGVKEVVTGIVTRTSDLDYLRMKMLCHLCPEIKFTFHKAIDVTSDPLVAIEGLKDIPNVVSILSSGGHATAEEGLNTLKEMKLKCGQDISLIPAGKITNENVVTFHDLLNVQEYHGRLIVGNLYE